MASPDSPTENFTYTTESGKTVTLRSFARIPAGVFRRTRDLDDMHQMFGIIEAGVVDDASLDAADEMPVTELGDLFGAWADSAEASLPKS